MIGQRPVVFPYHSLLILEERLKEQEAAGVRMPVGVSLDELALRILVTAEIAARKAPRRGLF